MCTTPPSGATPPVLSGIQANSSAPLGGPSSAAAPSALGALGGSAKAPTNESVQDLLARVAEAVKKLQELIAGMMGPGQGPVDPGQGPLDPTQVGQLDESDLPQIPGDSGAKYPAYGSTTPISIPETSAPETIAASKAMVQTRRAEIARTVAQSADDRGSRDPLTESIRGNLATKQLDRFEQLLNTLGSIAGKMSPLETKVLAAIGEDLASKGTYNEAAGQRLLIEVNRTTTDADAMSVHTIIALSSEAFNLDEAAHNALATTSDETSVNGTVNLPVINSARAKIAGAEKLRGMLDRIIPAASRITPQIAEMTFQIVRDMDAGKPFSDGAANAVYAALGV